MQSICDKCNNEEMESKEECWFIKINMGFNWLNGKYGGGKGNERWNNYIDLVKLLLSTNRKDEYSIT